MTSIGMIVMACYCGADLYYVGDDGSGQSPGNVVDRLRGQLGPGDIGFFTSEDGEYGECPFCGLVYELPNPEMLEWLPYMNASQVSTTIDVMQRTGRKQPSQPSGHFIDGRYLS